MIRPMSGALGINLVHSTAYFDTKLGASTGSLQLGDKY